MRIMCGGAPHLAEVDGRLAGAELFAGMNDSRAATVYQKAGARVCPKGGSRLAHVVSIVCQFLRLIKNP